MHTFVFEHPIFAFQDVRLADGPVLGEVGQGLELTKDWFVEERLMIGARTIGASARALDLSLAFAKEREQFGRPIVDFQAIEFMLADMAAEIMAAKSMLYRVVPGGVAWRRLQGRRSTRWRRRSSSSAPRRPGASIDKAVQIFGGRGYMREHRWNGSGGSCASIASGREPRRSSGS